MRFVLARGAGLDEHHRKSLIVALPISGAQFDPPGLTSAARFFRVGCHFCFLLCLMDPLSSGVTVRRQQKTVINCLISERGLRGNEMEMEGWGVDRRRPEGGYEGRRQPRIPQREEPWKRERMER